MEKRLHEGVRVAKQRARLPQDLIELGHKYGLAGQRVYFPKQKLHTLVTQYLPQVLKEIEATYDERGLTFYEEASPRRLFSGMFSKGKIAFRLNLKLRTAASVASSAWRLWREWFGRKERPRLEQVRIIAEENNRDYTPLFLSYLEIRQRLRTGQDISIVYYTNYHSVPAETIQQLIDLARASTTSCPWRDT
jgi:hypothetical protein